MPISLYATEYIPPDPSVSPYERGRLIAEQVLHRVQSVEYPNPEFATAQDARAAFREGTEESLQQAGTVIRDDPASLEAYIARLRGYLSVFDEA